MVSHQEWIQSLSGHQPGAFNRDLGAEQCLEAVLRDSEATGGGLNVNMSVGKVL